MRPPCGKTYPQVRCEQPACASSRLSRGGRRSDSSVTATIVPSARGGVNDALVLPGERVARVRTRRGRRASRRSWRRSRRRPGRRWFLPRRRRRQACPATRGVVGRGWNPASKGGRPEMRTPPASRSSRGRPSMLRRRRGYRPQRPRPSNTGPRRISSRSPQPRRPSNRGSSRRSKRSSRRPWKAGIAYGST